MNSNKRQTRIPSARTPTSEQQKHDQTKEGRPKSTKVTKPPGQTKASLKRQALALSKRLEHTRYAIFENFRSRLLCLQLILNISNSRYDILYPPLP